LYVLTLGTTDKCYHIQIGIDLDPCEGFIYTLIQNKLVILKQFENSRNIYGHMIPGRQDKAAVIIAEITMETLQTAPKISNNQWIGDSFLEFSTVSSTPPTLRLSRYSQ